jgi:hypothetical protein
MAVVTFGDMNVAKSPQGYRMAVVVASYLLVEGQLRNAGINS